MRSTKAKKIRQSVYGDRSSNLQSREYYKLATGQIIADKYRQYYQKVKKST